EQPGAHGPQRRRRVVVVHRDPQEARLAGALQAEQRLRPPGVLVQVLVLPDVELQQVDVITLQVLQALLAGAHDVPRRERLRDRHPTTGGPDEVLGRDLGRDVDRLPPLAQQAADQLLAAAMAVAERGVDEVDAEVDGAVQRPQALVVLRADPQRPADAPGAVADLGDLQARATQRARAHATDYPRFPCRAAPRPS